MEIVPFLIFAFIAFKVFSAFTKTSSSEPGNSAKDMMQRLNAQIEQAKNAQGSTARSRERPTMRTQNSPWDHEHDLDSDEDSLSPGTRVAAKYLQTTKAARKAALKNPEQYGRRGMNMDQNKNRTDQWGERGDSGFLNGKTVLILLVIGSVVLYVLSRLPAT